MKKILSFLLVGLITISFSACNSGPDKYGSEMKKLRENYYGVISDLTNSSISYIQGDKEALDEVSNQIDKLLDVSKKFKKLTPPDSVKELHENMITSFDNFVMDRRDRTDKVLAGSNIAISGGETEFGNFVKYEQEIYKILGIQWQINK